MSILQLNIRLKIIAFPLIFHAAKTLLKGLKEAMTYTSHRLLCFTLTASLAVAAVTAAGSLSALFICQNTPHSQGCAACYNQSYHYSPHGTTSICKNYLLFASLTFTSRDWLSLYGRNNRYKNPMTSATAIMVPIPNAPVINRLPI